MRYITVLLIFFAFSALAEETNYRGGPGHTGVFGLIGEELAEFEHKKHFRYNIEFDKHLPNSSTPFIYKGKIYLAYRKGFQVFDLRTETWRSCKLESRDNFYGSMIIHRDIALLGSSSNCTFHAVSVKDMKFSQIWSHKFDAHIESAPVASGDYVAFNTVDGDLYCYTLDGTQVWKTNYARYNTRYYHYRNYASPVVKDGIVYVNTGDAIRGYDMASGEMQINARYDDILKELTYSTPCISGDYAYVVNRERIYKVNIKNGTVRGYDAGCVGTGSPACDGEYVYVAMGHKHICLTADSLGDVWTEHRGYAVSRSTPLVLNNRVMFTDNHECAYLYEKQSGKLLGYNPMRRMGKKGRHPSTPIYYNNVVFWPVWRGYNLMAYWWCGGYKPWIFWKECGDGPEYNYIEGSF